MSIEVMANHRNSKSVKNKPPARSRAASPPSMASGPSTAIWTLGIVSLLLSVAASAMLVYQHLTGLAIPGCGAGSPCAELASSKWGRVPFLDLPVSSLGLAYFVAILIGWLTVKHGLTVAFKWIVRAGVAASAMFLIVMVMKQQPCRYCLMAHAGNIVFWLLMEFGSRSPVTAVRPVAASAMAFGVAGIILGGLEWNQRQKVAKAEEAALVQSTEKIAQGSTDGDSQAIAPATVPQTAPAVASSTQPQQRGFTGRYREGPENAPIRIVIFSDYQCSDCRSLEMQAKIILATNKNVSLSAKQFPLNKDCNPTLKETMHENACWGARVAEAAGILRGNGGFWKLHHWLFERGGGFTEEDLDAKLVQEGYDIGEFKRAMLSEEVARRIAADAEEAQTYGIMYTPMVFINGIELHGYRAPAALTRAVERLASLNLKPGTALDDRPPPATEKIINDWRIQQKLPMPSAARYWPAGATPPDKARVRLDVFGDLRDNFTGDLEPAIRALGDAGVELTYVYYNYPFDQDCNPSVTRTGNPGGCRAARAAEAAGILGGDEAYWKMHAYLLENRQNFSDDTIRAGATSLGLSPEALLQTMDGAEVAAAIVRDMAAAKALNVTQLPTIFLNGRFVPRWRTDKASVLDRLVAEAAKERP
jgi:protein-disulfide isomerase/uncharacterized membrane protein